MTEKSTMKFVKERVKELGLRDKMDFFQWLMNELKRDLATDAAQHQEA